MRFEKKHKKENNNNNNNKPMVDVLWTNKWTAALAQKSKGVVITVKACVC